MTLNMFSLSGFAIEGNVKIGEFFPVNVALLASIIAVTHSLTSHLTHLDLQFSRKSSVSRLTFPHCSSRCTN